MKDKILWTASNPDVHPNILSLFSDAHYDLAIETTAEKSIKTLQEKKIDLVLGLSDSEGMKVLQKLRKEVRYANLPFLVLCRSREESRQAMEQGATDCLLIPQQYLYLKGAIRAALDKRNLQLEWAEQMAVQQQNHLRTIKYHELRTPLFGVLSSLEFLDMALGSLTADETREYIQQATLSAERLNNSLTKLNRMETLNEEIPKPQAFPSIRKVLLESVEGIVAGEGKIMVAGEDFSLSFDQGQLQFIIQELLQNALKFQVGPGKIEVRVEGHNLTVRNRQRVFNKAQKLVPSPFFQPGRGVLEHQGMGLGLYVSRQYARLNNAKLSTSVGEDLVFSASVEFPPLRSTPSNRKIN